jgi:hypothetical protein
MIRCEVCNEEFATQEDYEAHWKYILETPQRQYDEMVELNYQKILDLLNKREDAKPS